jgi:hypothetical protein
MEVHPDFWGGAYVDDQTLVIKYVGQSEQEARQRLCDLGVSGGSASRNEQGFDGGASARLGGYCRDSLREREREREIFPL